MLQQNDNFYLTEAFNKLKLLDEDAFDLSADKGVTDELQSFVADDIEAPYEEEIIDVDADNNDELADDYLGKIILQCECCHAKVYKDPAEIILSEENEEIVNEDETCPACGTTNGWKIIGKIEPFNAEEFEDESESEGEVEDEFSDDEIGEALKEALNEGEDVCPHCGKNPCECDENCDKEKEKPLKEALLHESQERVQQVLDDAGIEYNRVIDNGNGGTIDISEHAIGDIDAVKDVLANAGIDSYWVLRYIDGQNEGLTEEVGNQNAKYEVWKLLDFETYTKRKLDKVFDSADEAIAYAKEKQAESDSNESFVISRYYVKVNINGHSGVIWPTDESLTEEVDVNINDKTAAEDAVKIEDSEQEPIKEELKNVQSEDTEKLEDCEKDPIKEALDENKEVDKKLMAKILFKLPKFTKAVANKYGKDAGKSKSEEVASLISANNLEAAYEMMLKEINESLTEDVDEAGIDKIWKLANKIADVDETESTWLFKNEDDLDKLLDLMNEYDIYPEYDNEIFKAYGNYYEGWIEIPEELNESYKKRKEADDNKSLTEDVDEVSVKADDQEVNVSVEPDGKLNISIDPKAEEENVEADAEMIAPLTDEEQAEIAGEAESPVEEAPAEDEFEVDDFDEESFDDLGESFLKRVYENVNSFNTSKVSYKKGQLVVEGLIKFNSGKEKATKFVFEGFKNTKRGKTLVAGINEMFSKSNRAFLLKGNLADKKFVSESLTYNYTAKSINEANESDTVRVYGRAVIRK